MMNLIAHTEDGVAVAVILNDLLIDGDFVVKSADTGVVLHDTRTDGGDVPPDLALCPVSWMHHRDGILTIDIIPTWEQ